MTFNPIQLSMEPEKIFLVLFGKDVSCMQGRIAIMETTLVQIEQKISSIKGQRWKYANFAKSTL